MTAAAQWSADPAQRDGRHIRAERAERRRHRSHRQQCDPLRRDRRLYRDARRSPGAGAERSSTRSPPRIGARAVRPHRRGHAGHCRRAGGLRCRSRRPARRQFGALDLHRQRDRHAAHRHAGPGRRPRRAAAVEIRRPTDPNDKVVGLDFSRRPRLRREPARRPRSAPTGLQFSNPAGNDVARARRRRANKVDVNAVSATNTVTSLTGGHAPSFRSSSTAMPPIPARSRRPGRRRVGFAGRIAVNASLLADPSRLVVFQTSPLTQPATRRGRTSSTIASTARRSRSRRSPASARRRRRSAARCRPSCAR